MAPLIQDSENISLSTQDDVFHHKTITIVAPLHETTSTGPRRVSFGAMEETHEVLSLVDYTPEEVEATWFTVDDMFRMKSDARSSARLVDMGLLVPGSHVSIRGLEGRTMKGIRRKIRCRMDAYAAVFSEIDFQHEEQHFDEETIADAYYIYSEPCAIACHMIGKHDEIEARDTI